MYLYLMRHGQTDWNAALKMQGRSDIPLNETGLAQARAAAQGMAGQHFDRIFTSPLIRARQTAEIIAAGRGIPVEPDARIIEVAFGALEGLDYPEHPDTRIIFSDPEHYVPTEGGESYDQLDARAADALEQLFAPLEPTCQAVLACSHGAFIKAIIRRVLRRPLRDFWIDPPQPNCSCTVLNCENGVFSLVEQGRVFS